MPCTNCCANATSKLSILANKSSDGEGVLLLIVPVRCKSLLPIIPVEIAFISTSNTLGIGLFLVMISILPISWPLIKISLIFKSISGSRLFLSILILKLPLAIPLISMSFLFLIKAKTLAIFKFRTSPSAEKSLADLNTASFKNNSLLSE